MRRGVREQREDVQEEDARTWEVGVGAQVCAQEGEVGGRGGWCHCCWGGGVEGRGWKMENFGGGGGGPEAAEEGGGMPEAALER